MFNRQAALRRTLIATLSLGLIATLWLVYVNFDQTHNRGFWVAHTQEALSQARAVLSNLQDAETGQRGYLLTGNESYLEPFRTAIQSDQEKRRILRRLTADNPSQQERIKALDDLARAKFAELERTIRLRQTGNSAAALAIVNSGTGKRLMDECRATIQAIEEEELHLLKVREGIYQAQADRMRQVIWVGGGSVLLLLGLAGILIGQSAKAQQALREKAQLLDLSYDAILVRDEQSRISFWNAGATELYGYRREEALGRSSHELLRTEFPQPLSAIVDTLRREGRWSGELVHTRKDGSKINVSSRWAVHRNAQGNIQAILETNSDITERKKSEEALRDREAKFRQLVEQVPIPLSYVDEEGVLVYLNARFVSAFGYTHQDVPTLKEWWQLAYPEESYRRRVVETWNAAVRRAALTNTDIEPVEYRLTCKDGSVRIVEISGITLGDHLLATLIDVTERKRAEQALRESEARLRAVLDALPVAVMFVDPNGDISLANRAMSELWGANVPTARIDYDKYCGWWLETGKRVEGHEWPCARAVKGVTTEQATLEIETFDHKRKFITVFASPMIGPQGENYGAIAVQQDITERRRAEEQLRTSEERFRSLAFATSHVIWIIGADGRVTADYPNLSWENFTGQTAEQIMGLGWLDAIHPEDRARVGEIWQKAVEAKSLYSADYRLRRHDGEYRWVEATGTPILKADGGVREWIGTSTDISERKQAQQALQESEQRVRRKLDLLLSPDADVSDFNLRDIIDAEAIQSLMADFYELAHVPTAIVDNEGNVIAGAGWQEICTRFHRVHPESLQHCIESDTSLTRGIAPGEYKVYRCKNNLYDVATPLTCGGKVMGNIFTGQMLPDDEAVDVELFRSQAEKYSFDAEAYLAALDKVPRLKRETVDRRAITFLGNFGDLIGKLGYANVKLAKSLAQLTEWQKSLRELNATLEQRVRERTTELEAANAELEAFAYSVSHDLRAPLRGIDGWSLALAEDYGDQLDQRAQGYLQRVRSESQRMGGLIDDLLALSRINRAEMRPGSVDLSALASAVAGRVWEGSGDRKVEFKIQPGLSSVGDAGLLDVVLTNLLSNAVKFTSKRPKAHIEFGRTARDGEAAFFVRDNGVGFDMAHADVLFGAFQRLHKVTDFPGTGIGLATVQRVIRRHRGRVWAESQPDQGATFYFTLETQKTAGS